MALTIFCRKPPARDAADWLESIAYRLTHEYTTTASFREHGRLLPWQQEALQIVISLALEAQG